MGFLRDRRPTIGAPARPAASVTAISAEKFALRAPVPAGLAPPRVPRARQRTRRDAHQAQRPMAPARSATRRPHDRAARPRGRDRQVRCNSQNEGAHTAQPSHFARRHPSSYVRSHRSVRRRPYSTNTCSVHWQHRRSRSAPVCCATRLPPARGRRSSRLGGRPGEDRGIIAEPPGLVRTARRCASVEQHVGPASRASDHRCASARSRPSDPASARPTIAAPRRTVRRLSVARGSRRAARGSRSTCSGRSRCRPRRTWAIARRPPARWWHAP